MESIIVKRPEVIYDSHGAPQYGDLVVWNTFDAFCAPNNPEESNLVGRNAVITGYTIYVTGDEPTGILNTDVIVVRGEDLAVTGRVAPWFNEFTGEYRGDQFAVREATG